MNTTSNILEFAWDTSWVYVQTVVDIAREAVLIMDSTHKVIDVNNIFCDMFAFQRVDVCGKSLYELGTGQWNTSILKTALSGIVPDHGHFKGFEMTAMFPLLGKRTLILSARQLYISKELTKSDVPVIVLTIEDVTRLYVVAETVTKVLHKNIKL